MVFLVGVCSFLGAFLPNIASRTRIINEMVPAVFPAAATTATAAIGLLLIWLSRALRRGKFRAWLIALVLSVIAVGMHVLHDLQIEAATLCLLLVALLASSRRNFTARPDPRSKLRLGAVAIGGPAAAAALGASWWAVRGAHLPTTTIWVALAVLALAALLLIVTTAIEPGGGPHRLTAEEHARVRALIDEWGWADSLAYFATRDDRFVVFSPSGQSAISYRVIGSVSLAAGDPLGNPADWPHAITAWLDEARAFGWTPGNLGASERAAAAFDRAGLEVLEVGDEAIVHVAEFSLEGRSMRGVRQAVARVERAGITAECYRVRDLTTQQRIAFREKAIAWRDGAIERGFSMALGRFGQRRDDDGVVVVARTPSGELAGLLSFAPWGKDGASLDLMRRSRTAEVPQNGIVEFMVTSLMNDAERLGITKISLNFSAFRSTFARGERLGAGPATRAWRAILMWASHFAQIEALYRSNSKYRPEWVPRFVVYPRATDLAQVATAAIRAEALVAAPGWYRRLTGNDGRGNAIDEIPEIESEAHVPAGAVVEREHEVDDDRAESR